MYEYRARWVEVYDGDTIRAEVDLGLDTYHRLTLRLAGIDAPEMGTPEGAASKAHLSSLIADSPVLVRTIKDRKEKYGRYLAILLVTGLDGLLRDVNQRMITDGFAKVYP